MKKTLLISEIFPPTNGGSGRWFWELYTRLPSDEYLIIAGKTNESQAFDETHNLNVKRLDLSSPSWGIKSKSGLAFYWRTFWQLKKIIKKHKITHIHCGRCLPEGVMGWLLKQFTKINFLCYVHGEDIETASTSRELSWLVKNVLKSATKLISNSENTANLLINNWQADKHKVTVLHPGCDTKKFIPAELNLEIRSHLTWFDRTVILTVGRLQKRKGHDMLISALPKIKESYPDILYAIVGHGEELNTLQELVKRLELEKNVIFHSEISDEEMIQCYQQCDLFILPNRTVNNDIEGFGMVLIEAQACGIPVIAGNSGGTKETMIIGETGFIIDCTQPQNIALHVTSLLKNESLYQTMKTQARAHITETLDWSVHVNKATTIFSQLDTSINR